MKTAALNLDKERNKHWKMVRSLYEDTFTARQNMTMEKSGNLSTGKQAADLCDERYKSYRNMTISKDVNKE